jgi:hypothetical protein
VDIALFDKLPREDANLIAVVEAKRKDNSCLIDLVGEKPKDNEDFVIGACAYIGVKDEGGVEYFYFRIVTPKRLSKLISEKKIIDGRATFIVDESDFELNFSLVEKQINDILKDSIRPTWDETAKAINRFLKWEYDNIQYETFDELQKRLFQIIEINFSHIK